MSKIDPKLSPKPAGSGRFAAIAGFWQKAATAILPADREGGNYRTLIRARWPELSFCFLFIFVSGYGQTFLLSIFQPYWREALDLSMTQMGGLYSVATLGSAFFLPWAGRWLDRSSSARAAFFALAGLMVAGLLAASAVQVWVLGLALWALRFFGQGFSAHIGATRSAQWFTVNRGKAVSLTALGFTFSEALMPITITLLIGAFHWQIVWLMLTAAVLLLWGPGAFYFLRRREASRRASGAASEAGTQERPSRGPLLQDWRFYAMLLITMPVPFIGTGVIFFQATIAETRGWAPSVFALGFIVFAVARALFSILAGAWVDYIGSLRMLALPTALFAAGLLFLTLDGVVFAFVFFALMGVGFGASSSVMTTAWTDLFGAERIGMIRGLSSSVGVVATALAPAVFGLAFDFGFGVSTVLLVCAVFMAVSAWPMCLLLKRRGMVL